MKEVADQWPQPVLSLAVVRDESENGGKLRL